MTVQELIGHLAKADPNAKVFIVTLVGDHPAIGCHEWTSIQEIIGQSEVIIRNRVGLV